MRNFILSLIAFWLLALPLQAASRAEIRAFTEASTEFNARLWERADKLFGEFADKYHSSTNAPMAILLQAEARIQLGRLTNAIDLLSAHFIQSDGLADQYLFWMAQANFQSGNYLAAADAFARVTQGFPNSSRWLEAVLGRANAYAKLERWDQVAELLNNTDGAFQLTTGRGATNELVFRGKLLLAQAQFMQRNYDAAESTLTDQTNAVVGMQLQWQRQDWLCRVQLADGRAEEALQSADELLKLAGTSALRPQSSAFRAAILEKLGRLSEAITAYQNNLGEEIPVRYQQAAIFKIAELSQILGRSAEAANQLEKFLGDNPNSPVADVVLLTLGDLQLKQYLATRATNQPPDEPATLSAPTNFLQTAMARYQAVLGKSPPSPLAGQAWLNEGWCYWFAGEITNSLTAFQTAAALPYFEGQLTARFKWAEAQSQMGDFAGAIMNFNFVVTHARAGADSPSAELIEPALYQLVRAGIEAGDMQTVTNALAMILDAYPNSFIADRSLLLAGQGFTLRADAAQARALFSEAESRYPDSKLLPQIRLAIARTYELNQDWTNAIRQYDEWLGIYTNNPAMPQAEFYRAWANYQAGNEANALMLFTNFVSRFRNDPLAPPAQLWIGDHYFREGDFVNAERNYQTLYLTWPATKLAYQAWMMAGRSAVARFRYPDAIYYFTNLTSDVNCPRDVRAQALFAYGDAKMSMTASDTNKQANLELAISIFGQISVTNSLHAAAVGQVGNCNLQLAVWDARRYEAASNAYQQVLTIRSADVATRSQATMGLGIVAEKMAQQEPEAEQTALLNQAVNHYLDVFHGVILREGETPDPFWVKQAGLEAARLEESLKNWAQALGIYEQMKEMFPSLTPMLEKKIANVRMQQNPERSTE